MPHAALRFQQMSRGLTKKRTGLRIIQTIAVLTTLLVWGIQIAVLSRSPDVKLSVAHSLTMILIALATYDWVLLPMAMGVVMSLLALITTAWGWANTHSSLLGGDLVALLALTAFVSWQQQQRRRRLHRLEQTLDDLEEESYVKEQNLRVTEQTNQALTRKLARYQRLQTIAEQLSALVELDRITQLAVRQAFELIGKSDVCLLFLVDKDRQELSLHAAERSPEVSAVRSKQGDHFDRYVLRTQRPLLVSDVMRDFRFSHGGSSDRSIRSVMACPLRIGQQANGVLRLDSQQAGVYTQDDLRFLDILLDLVDAAIANARLFSQTQQLALTDGLTGLFRRQPLLDQLGREVARANRTREPLAVLMLDIDNFKRYNDTFGHSAGDVVLRSVADLMRQTVPPEGFCARYGGEEFAVLLANTTPARAAELGEKIRQAVERGVARTGEGAGKPVTVSIGVAVFPDDARSGVEVVRRADERLYQAKRAGKNRVWSS